MDRSEPRSGSLQGWLVVVAFLGPLALAIAWYALRDVVPVPAPRTEGTLIVPARPVASFAGVAQDGRDLGPELFRGHWTLVYVADRDCELDCQALLFKARQLRLTLGKDLPRVRWLALASDGWRAPELSGGDVPVVRISEVPEAFGPRAQGALFIVDPLGNVMMRYGPDAEIRGMQKDLKRLLKVSQIG